MKGNYPSIYFKYFLIYQVQLYILKVHKLPIHKCSWKKYIENGLFFLMIFLALDCQEHFKSTVHLETKLYNFMYLLLDKMWPINCKSLMIFGYDLVCFSKWSSFDCFFLCRLIILYSWPHLLCLNLPVPKGRCSKISSLCETSRILGTWGRRSS